MARTYHLPKSARTKHDGFKRERRPCSGHFRTLMARAATTTMSASEIVPCIIIRAFILAVIGYVSVGVKA
ncbi:MAG: hypothetical protein ACXWNL_18895, partial [Vulcanimicrobiaceae bacterium]